MNSYLLDSARGTHLLTGLIFLFAFLLGSIPFGLIVGRIFRGKPSRISGFWPAGFLTFFLDATKGVLAVLLATPVGCHLIAIFLGAEGGTSTFQLNETSIWAAGFFAILGHCFPPWLHFKGGKGIATTLGVTLVLSPIAALFGLLGFGITFWHKRIISLASLSGALVAAIAFLVLNPIEAYLWVGAAILFLILLRHEKNIDALLENKEKAFP